MAAKPVKYALAALALLATLPVALRVRARLRPPWYAAYMRTSGAAQVKF